MSAESHNYLLVEPAHRRVTPARFQSLDAACAAVGLSPNEIDMGSLGGGHGIVVFEYGLVKPLEQQRLFAIGQCLYEGNAVIYAEDSKGERIDASPLPIRWFKNADEVWQAIEQEEIIQPSMAVNGEVLWVWPDSKVR
jgi:hypothetical protein